MPSGVGFPVGDAVHPIRDPVHESRRDIPQAIAVRIPSGRLLTGPHWGLVSEPSIPIYIGPNRIIATRGNVITPIDVFLPSGDHQHAVAYFRYDWTVNDDTLITFNVMDLFEFRSGTDQVGALTLIYGTHPIRQTVGNKYES